MVTVNLDFNRVFGTLEQQQDIGTATEGTRSRIEQPRCRTESWGAGADRCPIWLRLVPQNA